LCDIINTSGFRRQFWWISANLSLVVVEMIDDHNDDGNDDVSFLYL